MDVEPIHVLRSFTMQMYRALCAAVLCATSTVFADVTTLRLPESQVKPPPVPLTETTSAERQKQVAAWLKQQYADYDAADPACASLAWFINAWLRPGVTEKADISDKYFFIAAEQFNKTQELTALVAATKLPAEIKAAWRKRHAEELIELRLAYDIQAEAKRLAEIRTEGATVVTVADGAGFSAALGKAYPAFSTATPEEQARMLRVLVEINGGLRFGGYYVTTAANETRPHIALRTEDGKTKVIWLRHDASLAMLLPAYDWLRGQAAKVGEPFFPTVLDRPALTRHAVTLTGLLRLAEAPLELTIVRRGKAVENVFATTPTLHNLPHRVVIDRRAEKLTLYVSVAYDRDADQLKIELNEPTGRFTATRVAGAPLGDDVAFQAGKSKPVATEGAYAIRPVAAAPGDEIRENWTWWRGPGGMNASQVDVPLVEQLQDARLVWVSDLETPMGRGPDTRGKIRRVQGSPLMGGWASPIVADNRVFLNYYVPSGESYANNAGAAIKAGEDAYLHRINLVDADDVIHAIDARTGATLWKRSFVGAGLNPAGFNKSGPQLTPASANGRVFAVGSIGNVYALDAATGEVVWQTDIDRRARITQNHRAWLKAQGRMYGARSDFNSALIPVADVVVTCDYARTKGGDGQFRYELESGLMAFDQATGAPRWHLPSIGASAASSWQHNGVDYLVAPGVNCIMLIEARTGKIVWEEKGIDGAACPPVANDIVLVNVGDAKAKTSSLAAYKLTLTRPEKLWQLGANTGYGDMSAPTIVNGRVFYATRKLLCVELATGKLVPMPEVGFNGAHTGAPGRIIGWDDIGHQKPTGAMVSISESAATAKPHFLEIAASYDTSIHNPVVDGRLIVRTVNRVLCFDLRANSAARDHAHGAAIKGMPRTAPPPVPPLPLPKVKDDNKSPLQDLEN